MSASIQPTNIEDETARLRGARLRGARIRNGAIALGCLALAFYLGFIALLVLRSRH